MSKIILHPLKEFRFPIIAECISPDVFRDKTCREIGAMEVWEGNRQRQLRELFKVEESPQDQVQDTFIAVEGDLSEVRRIGAFMTTGQIFVRGNVGLHLGEEMGGGKIVVNGNVGAWTGSMMRGGIIEIQGNAGDYLAAPYRGSTKGMCGGKITIHGSVGVEAGAHMRKGMIQIYGDAGQFVGFRMQDGTIYVQGDCEARLGACMIGGKIVVAGHLESILPTFTTEGIRDKVNIEKVEPIKGPFYVFLGDIAENGNGKLYVSREKNQHLSHYERWIR